MRPTLILAPAALALAGTATSSVAFGQGTKAAPPATFARCAICHNAEKGGADKLGPNLWGKYGAKAGVGKFSYSPAMKASKVTWTDANLNKYLDNPKAFIPGNRMSFPGLKNPAQRAEIIAYLRTRK